MLRAFDAEMHVNDVDVIEVHAGAEYREYGLCAGLRELGCQVDVPILRVGIGEQLRFNALARAKLVETKSRTK